MTLRDLTVLTIKISGVVLFVLLVARLPEYLKAYLAIRGQSPLLGDLSCLDPRKVIS
jgi:hypothetical protein